MTATILLCLLWGCMIIASAVTVAALYFQMKRFKGDADRFKNGAIAHGRPGDSPRYGLRDRLMARILEARLDE